MVKKILLLGALIWIAGASYVYYQSQQKPTDVYVATDTILTGEVLLWDIATTGDTTFTVLSWSLLWWKATKPWGEHTWSVVISNWILSVNSWTIVNGSFDIDMTSIKLLDIDNAKLEWEIRDDFFEAVKHPTTKFVIIKSENQWNVLTVYGDLTIKGVTQSINFPANLIVDGNSAKFVASFAIDRLLRGLTMWEGKVNNYLEFEFDLSLSQ